MVNQILNHFKTFSILYEYLKSYVIVSIAFLVVFMLMKFIYIRCCEQYIILHFEHKNRWSFFMKFIKNINKTI